MCRGWLATRQSAGAASLLGDVLPGACCFVALVHAGGTYLPAHLIQPSSDFLVHVRVCTRTHMHTHTHPLALYSDLSGQSQSRVNYCPEMPQPLAV